MPPRKLLFAAILLSVATAYGQSASPQPSSPATSATESAKPGSSPSTSTTAGSIPPDSTQLIVVKFEKPKYPPEAEREQLQGRVVVHLTISETGDVESAEPVSGNPILSAATIRAMKDWKFKPYIKGGHPVKVSTNQAYEFAFEGHVMNTPTSAGTPTFQPPGSPNSSAGVTTTREASSQPGNGASTDNSSGSGERRVRVAQGVTQGLLIHKVVPIYPDSARAARVQGTVVLQAIIGKDGHVENLRVISGPEPLTAAAIQAVEQWRYKPYYLEGRPVEVETSIRVNFMLR